MRQKWGGRESKMLKMTFQIRYVYIMKYYAAIKKNEVVLNVLVGKTP